MATVNLIQSKRSQSKAGLKFILSYCKRDSKTVYGDKKLIGGVNCVAESAYHEMLSTKMRYGKTDGRMFYHLVQSFSPEENITPETAYEIALKFAEREFPEYEVLVAAHTDKAHIHSHFIINSVRHLMMVLSALPDIEIVCTDSSECFDDNKAYLTERLKTEENGRVKKLIKKDIDFLDNIQTEMATARQFFFVARLKSQKEKQVFETANRIESKIAGEGFEVHRLKKPEIKRILALYFEASMQGEAMPDIDGEQFYEGTDDEDEE